MPLHENIQRPITVFLVLLSVGIAGSSPATAQRSQAGRTTEQFEAKASERARKRAAPPIPELAVRQQGADVKPLFVLAAVELTGVTVLARDAIGGIYQPYLGKSVSQADLLRIADGITGLYRQEGYALTRAFVPAQDVKQERIRIKVVEGYIGEVVLEGDGAERFGARGLLQAVTNERPVRLATLERHLLLLSDTPGLRITDTALEEIGQATGRFRLIVRLEAWRLFANVDLDNRGTPDIGPLQSFMSTALNSGLVQGDTWTVNLSTIPDSPQELAYMGGAVDLPVGTQGARIGVRASYSDLQPNGERRLLNTRTRTEEFGMYASLAPLRTRQASLKLTALAGLRNAEEGDDSGTIYDDRIRALSLTADYQVHDTYEGSNYFVVTLRRGLGVLGASEKGDFQLSRSDASGEFYKVYWGFTRYQRLGGPWSALLSTTGQLASSPLLQSEEFYLGGPLFGRAFATGDLSGDSGMTGLLEVRLDQKHEVGHLKGYQLYAFLDTGIVWNRGSADHQSLSSYGAGLRLSLQDDLRAGFEVALPIDDHSPSNHDRGTRVFFSLSKSFKSCAQLSCSQ